MMATANTVSRHWAPGVQIKFDAPEKGFAFRTGIPAFVGFCAIIKLTDERIIEKWRRITSWQQFEQDIKLPLTTSYLSNAVRGFFENGGECCVIVPVSARDLTADALAEPFLDTLSEQISETGAPGGGGFWRYRPYRSGVCAGFYE